MRLSVVAGGAALALLAVAALSLAAAGQPDLSVSVDPAQDLPDGSSVPVTVTLHNLGDVGAPASSVLVAIDGNPTDPPLDFGPLAAGASQSQAVAFSLGCGAHAVAAVADPGGLVNESDESNNGAISEARVVPIASFTAEATYAPAGPTLRLDASASVGCRPLAFDWTVVPGGTSSGETVSMPALSGNVSVTLTVTSVTDPSVHATAAQIVAIKNTKPWVAASFPPAPLYTGTPCGLIVNATDVDGTVESYEIDWGDGSSTASLALAGLHPYAYPGTYAVAVTATDNLGDSNITLVTVTVLNRPPDARVVPASASVAAGKEIELSGILSSDPEGTALTYAWSFGDGNDDPTGGVTVRHTFDAPGEYLVSLTVTDGNGSSSTGTARVTVAGEDAAGSAGPEVPLLMALVFAGSAGGSFLFARSRTSRPAKRRPAPPRAGSSDPPPRRLAEEE